MKKIVLGADDYRVETAIDGSIILVPMPRLVGSIPIIHISAMLVQSILNA